MSDINVTALDHTVQQTNVWLKKLVEEQHFNSRQEAYAALRAVLHALRDRLKPEQAVHLGAQLPTMIRGIFYEGWHIAGTPTKERSADDFGAHIGEELPPQFRKSTRARWRRSARRCRRRSDATGRPEPESGRSRRRGPVPGVEPGEGAMARRRERGRATAARTPCGRRLLCRRAEDRASASSGAARRRRRLGAAAAQPR
jgi:uncharacterized protein (DUF2267 family)